MTIPLTPDQRAAIDDFEQAARAQTRMHFVGPALDETPTQINDRYKRTRAHLENLMRNAMTEPTVLYLVTGDLGEPTTHKTFDLAVLKVIALAATMKRTKHPRHGRKRWSIYQLGEDGSSIFLAYGWAYQEVDQVEIATTKALGNHRARYNLDTMKQEAAKHGT